MSEEDENLDEEPTNNQHSRRTVLQGIAGATVTTGLGSATVSAKQQREPTQLTVEDEFKTFGRLFEAQPLLEKVSEEGFLSTASGREFPITTLQTDLDGGIGRFDTGSWFGEQYVFLTYLDDAEVQIIVSDRGYPSAMVDPVDTDDQRIISVGTEPQEGEPLSSVHYDIEPAQVACDEECWCDGCLCCPANDFEKIYCRDVYHGDCIVTNRCECE